MIVQDSQPFKVVDDQGFRALVSLLDPTYVLPSRQTLKSMMEARYREEKQKAKDKVQKATAVALTSDMWTSIHMDSYLAFTCHFVDEEDKLATVLLAVAKFGERHTASNIATVKGSILEEWEIPKAKVMCLTTDGASNMHLCSSIMEVRHSHCIAHALNLVVKKALKLTPGLEEVRTKARDIATYFRTSTVARERLLCLQNQMGGPTNKLIQEVDTRWNSTLDMLQRLYEQREPVGAALASLQTDVAPLTSNQYHSISQCISLLAPLKEATVELSAEKHVSGSKIIPLVKMLRHIIATKQRQLTDEMARDLAKHLLTLTSEKLGNYEVAGQHALATLLDPRFKTMGFCNTTHQQNGVKKLMAECATVIRQKTPDPAPSDDPTPSTSHDAPSTSDSSGLWELLDAQVLEKRKVKSATANASVETNRYLAEPNIPRNEDPLEYWVKHKHVYPHLFVLARNLLCIPASSVPCERVFSKAGEIVSKKRNRLNPSTVEKIVFLNKNRF
ncbi:zinc finger BED domain-containing protein 4-like [Eleginops maclovinus]